MVRAAFGLFTGPFDYSDIMVCWQGASAFTNMKQPILPEFADPANDLVGLGPSGIVGVAGPFLASQAFANFAHNGAYPDPATLLQFPLGYVKRKFPNPYAEETSLEVENEIAKNLFVSVGYQFVHGLKLPVYVSVNGVPNGTLPDRRPGFRARRSQLWIHPGGHSNGILHLSRGDFECAKTVCSLLQHPGELHLFEVHRYRNRYPTHRFTDGLPASQP